MTTFRLPIEADIPNSIARDAEFIAAIDAHNNNALAHQNLAGKTVDLGYDVVVIGGQSNGEGAGNPIRLPSTDPLYPLQATIGNNSVNLPINDPYFDCNDFRILQYVLKAGSPYLNQVAIARDPLQHNGIGGTRVGFGMNFARALLLSISHTRRVLIVPAAVGGTSFSGNQWNPGDSLATALVQATIRALALNPSNRLRALLWHQGEGDAQFAMLASVYQTKLDALFSYFRTQVPGATNCPIIIGGMSPNWTEQYNTAIAIDLVHRSYPHRFANTWFVDGDRDAHNLVGVTTASQLATPEEHIHYNAAGQRMLGDRMFLALSKAEANGATISAPTPLINSGVLTSSTAVVNWSIPTGTIAYSYEISYRVTGTTSYIIAGVAYNQNTFKIKGLSPVTSYDIKVRSRVFTGFSPDSNVITVLTSSSVVVPAPYCDYDISNPSNVIKDGSNLVSQLSDISGNSRHLLQPNAPFKMLYLSDGGLNYLQSNKTNNLYSANAFPVNTSYTICVIARLDNHDGNGILLAGTTVSGHMIWRIGTQTNIYAGNSAAAPTANWTAVVAPLPQVKDWYCFHITHDIVSKAMLWYTAGILRATGVENVTNTDASLSLNSFGDANAGNMGSVARYLRATVWNSVLTQSQISQEVERLSKLYNLEFTQ